MYYFKLPTPIQLLLEFLIFIKATYANLTYIKRFFCLLLHVSAELSHLQRYFTPILKTDHVYYNCNYSKYRILIVNIG